MGNVPAMPAHVFQTAQENHVVAEETFRLCDVDRLSQAIRKLHRSIEQHPHSKQADTTCCVSAERRSNDSYPSSDDGDVPEWRLHFSNRANPLPLTDKRQLHYRSHMYMETEGLECILPDHMAQLEDIIDHTGKTTIPAGIPATLTDYNLGRPTITQQEFVRFKKCSHISKIVQKLKVFLFYIFRTNSIRFVFLKIVWNFVFHTKSTLLAFLKNVRDLKKNTTFIKKYS